MDLHKKVGEIKYRKKWVGSFDLSSRKKMNEISGKWVGCFRIASKKWTKCRKNGWVFWVHVWKVNEMSEKWRVDGVILDIEKNFTFRTMESSFSGRPPPVIVHNFQQKCFPIIWHMLQKRHFFPFLWRKKSVSKNSDNAYPIILTSAPVCPVWKEVSCGWAIFHILRDLYQFLSHYCKGNGMPPWVPIRRPLHVPSQIWWRLALLQWLHHHRTEESTNQRIYFHPG